MIHMLPLMLVCGVLPLLLRMYVYDNRLTEHAWVVENGESTDLFLHCKMVFFEGMLVILVLLFVIYAYNNYRRMEFPKIFCCLIGYMALALGSTLFSEYRSFGMTGIHEQFENMWCLLGYAFVIIYMYYMISERRQIDLLVYTLLASSLVIGMIGASQFLGTDVIVSGLAQKLYIPHTFQDVQMELSFGVGTVYLTLYNPDYVGLYTCLLCPVLAVVFWCHKKIIVRILALLSLALLTVSTIGATVSSGYIGLGVTAVVFIVMMLRQMTGSKKRFLAGMACILCAALFVTGVVYLKGYLGERHQTTETSAGTENAADDEAALNAAEGLATGGPVQSYKLEKITETDDYVEFCYDGIIFRENMKIEDGVVYLEFTDEQGNPIAYDYDEASMMYTLTEKGLEGITSISSSLLDKYVGFITVIDDKSWAFAMAQKDGVISYYTFNPMGRLDKNINSESAVFTDHYGLFNGRGYIWAKTIPLLKENILFGSGADSFVLKFPQSDYLSAYKGGYENLIISKPHCAYLQIAVQTGMLSLILLGVFYLWYVVRCLKLYFWKKEITFEQALGAAVFAGSAGFLVIWLANDSTICVTPVFAVMLGLGIVLNRRNAQKENG